MVSTQTVVKVGFFVSPVDVLVEPAYFIKNGTLYGHVTTDHRISGSRLVATVVCIRIVTQIVGARVDRLSGDDRVFLKGLGNDLEKFIQSGNSIVIDKQYSFSSRFVYTCIPRETRSRIITKYQFPLVEFLVN